MSNIDLAPARKAYATPKLVCRGDISALTQEYKEFGIGDGYFLIIPGIPTPVPIKGVS